MALMERAQQRESWSRQDSFAPRNGGQGWPRRDGVAGSLGLSIPMSSSAELPLPRSPGFKAAFWQLKVLKKQGIGSFFSPGACSCLLGGLQDPITSRLLRLENGLTGYCCGNAGPRQQYKHPSAPQPRSALKVPELGMKQDVAPGAQHPKGDSAASARGPGVGGCCPGSEHLVFLGQGLL